MGKIRLVNIDGNLYSRNLINNIPTSHLQDKITELEHQIIIHSNLILSGIFDTEFDINEHETKGEENVTE